MIGSVPLRTQQTTEEARPVIFRPSSDSPLSADRSSNILYAWNEELNVDSRK